MKFKLFPNFSRLQGGAWPLRLPLAFWRGAIAIALALAMTFGPAADALAARSGGRMGGGSFRRSAPTRSYSGGGTYRSGGFGGGLGFPFLLPFFGFGGFGSLFTLLIGLAVINFLVNAFRNFGGGEGGDRPYSSRGSGLVTVAQVQVGLLATARSLQEDLDRMGQSADTGTEAGRAQVLQETVLSLLRHPEYWKYGNADCDRTSLEAAETAFGRLSLMERSKFTEETLSNYGGQLQGRSPAGSLAGAKGEGEGALVPSDDYGEYIVVTILIAVEANLAFPATITSATDLRQAISQMGTVSASDLLALEVLWTPQASGDALTTDDMMAHYPELRLV
jgi:uncharacterized membrane protein